MSVPRGRQPLLASRRVATAIVDVRFSMSTAPRPHTMPSINSAPNGSRCQPDGFTGTTSVCPINNRVGVLGSLPSIRVMRLIRPGSEVYRSQERPVPAKKSSSAATLRSSWPDEASPVLTQPFLIRVRRSSVAWVSITVSSDISTPPLQAQISSLARAGALDAPARELREHGVPVHAEPARGAAHVPAGPLEHAQDVLALELLRRLAQRRPGVLAEARAGLRHRHVERDILKVDDRAPRQDDRPMEHVLELAHVAG